MARKIDLNRRLSQADRKYLLDRNRVQEVQENEAKFGQASPEYTGEQRKNRIAELRAELERLEVEQAAQDNPNVSQPVTGIGGGVKDNTVVDGERPEGAPEDEEDDYEDEKEWSTADLRAEIIDRNKARKKMGLSALPSTGSRSEMIDRLRQDDQDKSDK